MTEAMSVSVAQEARVIIAAIDRAATDVLTRLFMGILLFRISHSDIYAPVAGLSNPLAGPNGDKI
jgi:hypothetical protein